MLNGTGDARACNISGRAWCVKAVKGEEELLDTRLSHWGRVEPQLGLGLEGSPINW